MNRQQCRALALAVALVMGPVAAQAAQRVFVASTGNDASVATGCLITAPCRSFAAAMGQVDPGGEIVALDAAGYGAVTITKSVTITANPGYYAGIAAATGAAVTIDAAEVNVVLRGLVINGIGGDVGIRMTSGAFLTVENCVISNFGQEGIRVATQARVSILDTVVRGNGQLGQADGILLSSGAVGAIAGVRANGNSRAGVFVEDAGANLSGATVNDSDISANGFGVVAYSTDVAGAVRVAVARSTLAGNTGTGISAFGAGGAVLVGIASSTVTANGVGISIENATVESQGNNFVRVNSEDDILGGTVANVGGV